MTKEIPLTQGKTALIDDEDYPLVSQYKWYAKNNGNTWYAATCHRGNRNLQIQQLILGGRGYDHVDGDRLNNTRKNLRKATTQQNSWNRRKMINRDSSKYKGVQIQNNYRYKISWISRIYANGKQYYLGSFNTEIEAAKAYDAKALELFGDFAWLNFPIEKSRIKED